MWNCVTAVSVRFNCGIVLLLFQSGLIVGLCYCCFSQVSLWGCVTAVLVRFHCGAVLLLFQSGLIVGLCTVTGVSVKFNCGVVFCYWCFSQV